MSSDSVSFRAMGKRSIFFQILITYNLVCGPALCSGYEYTISDTVHNVLKTVQGFVGGIQDLVGDKQGCLFTCPDGKKPLPNVHHRPTSNGCGAFGMQFDSQVHVRPIGRCCDEHDICYDSCNKRKLDCDKDFKECLQSTCKKARKIMSEDLYKGCKSAADVMYAGTVALGCKPYRDAQQKACVCKSQKYDYDL